MNKPESWDLGQLLGAELGQTMVLATRSVRKKATQSLPFEQSNDLANLPDDLDTLIVIGGGTLIDEVKAWRAGHAPVTRLIAIPSLWGSGAEVSPVAVLNRQGKKEIHIGDELIPDVVCIWPELASSIPENIARYACGDAWSHALEGFLSPLASSQLQNDLAEVMQEMLTLPLGRDPRWFGPSARACAGQARSSVGLVHGIAHNLEGYLRTEFPAAGWGHAKLCSLFLWPVMEFNRQHSSKWQNLMQQHDLDEEAILQVLQELHKPDVYDQALPFLQQYWMEILRDPSSRTNSVLVRPGSKSFFVEHAFL